jgi:predicted acetyltransferase
MVSIRGAREADLDRLVEVHVASYPDERNAAARKLNFTNNASGPLADLVVATDGGVIVGHGFGFAMRAYFGGVAVPVVGIASIAVAPEARGRGIARAILGALEARGKKRGAAVAILHAFRHGFYARVGYADVAPNQRLACDPRALPKTWIAAARAANLRAARPNDAARIRALHDDVAKTQTGWLERSEARIRRTLANERTYVVVADAGYVSFEMSQSEPHDETRILVRDFVAKDHATRRALFGFLATQSGQSSAIEIETRIDDPISFALTDIDGGRFGSERVEHDLGGIVAGPMIRMLDVRAALAARGFSREGTVDLVVDKKPMRIVARGGRAKIGRGESRGAVVMNARTLASIAFGGLRASDAASLGLVRGREEAIDAADALLHIPPFFTVDRF